jgi:hypothetical protein
VREPGELDDELLEVDDTEQVISSETIDGKTTYTASTPGEREAADEKKSGRRRRRRRGGRRTRRDRDASEPRPEGEELTTIDNSLDSPLDAEVLDFDAVEGEMGEATQTLGESSDVADGSAVEEGTDTGSDTEPKRKRRRRRRRGSGRKSREGATKAGEEDAIRASNERDADEDDDGDDDSVAGPGTRLGDDDDHEGHLDKNSHRAIPSWQDAIGMIVAVNMEARAKSPRGDRPRGRGRGRGQGGRGGNRGPR